jgi:hypothetical protein
VHRRRPARRRAADRREAVRITGQHAKSDRPAPILDDQGDIAQIQGGDEAVQPVDMAAEGVVGELVGAPRTDVVRCDGPQALVGEHTE